MDHQAYFNHTRHKANLGKWESTLKTLETTVFQGVGGGGYLRMIKIIGKFFKILVLKNHLPKKAETKGNVDLNCGNYNSRDGWGNIGL